VAQCFRGLSVGPGRTGARPPAQRAATVGLALTAGALLLAGCEPTGDIFSEYRGTNLIPEAGFDSGVWELVGFTDGSTVLSDADLATYAHVEPVTDGSASADTTDLPDGTTSSEIRRLELKNLFPNGDFDTPDASAWDDSDPNATASIVSSGGDTINGNGLRYDIAATDAFILYQLNGANGLVDATSGTFAGEGYALRFDFLTETRTTLGHNDGTSVEYKTWTMNTASIAAELYDFRDEAVPAPELAVNQGGAEYLSINLPFVPAKGERVPEVGTLDNIRAARSDLSTGYQAVIPVSPNEFGEFPFLNGPYRFSVYLRTDPTHTNDADTADQVANRFPAKEVTVRMGVYRLDDTGTPIASADLEHAAVATNPGSGEGSWTSWQQVSVEGTLQVEDADYSDRELGIVLTVQPTDTRSSFGLSPGSVLIARPGLEFLVDPPAEE